jgi:hypothetical protein
MLPYHWFASSRKYLKWLPFWNPCVLHQWLLIVGAGLKSDKPFLKQVMTEAATQHSTSRFVGYTRREAQLDRARRAGVFLDGLQVKQEQYIGRVLNVEEASEFRWTNEMYANIMVDRELEGINAEFEAKIAAEGGAGLDDPKASGRSTQNGAHLRISR